MGRTEWKRKLVEVAYWLELPLEAIIIHNVFHIFQLKQKLSQAQHLQHFQLALTEKFELQVTLESVLEVGWNNEMWDVS